jgi:hypothetical protein
VSVAAPAWGLTAPEEFARVERAPPPAAFDFVLVVGMQGLGVPHPNVAHFATLGWEPHRSHYGLGLSQGPPILRAPCEGWEPHRRRNKIRFKLHRTGADESHGGAAGGPDHQKQQRVPYCFKSKYLGAYN